MKTGMGWQVVSQTGQEICRNLLWIILPRVVDQSLRRTRHSDVTSCSSGVTCQANSPTGVQTIHPGRRQVRPVRVELVTLTHCFRADIVSNI
jgi:hypothetical protein